MFNCRRITSIAVIAASGCGSCGDTLNDGFFGPDSFGVYEFVESARLDTTPVLDYGVVAPGARAERELQLASVGRLPVTVESISASSDDFEVLVGRLSEDNLLEPGERLGVRVVLTPSSDEPVRAYADIVSNDDVAPVQQTLLIANQSEPCVGSFDRGVPVWEVHDGEGPRCWDATLAEHGSPEAYQFSNIPPADDQGWQPEPDNRISFERRSALCGTDCACRGGGDFTYFQTSVYVPAGQRLSYVVDIDSVDDGARVTVFNERYPGGVTRSESYARIPGGSTADIGPDFVAGLNRVVITHIDDCCSISSIANVAIRAEQTELQACSNAAR